MGFVFFAGLAVGCIDQPSFSGRVCGSTEPCPDGFLCVDLVCQELERDGGRTLRDGGGGEVDGSTEPDSGVADGCWPCEAPPRPECSEAGDVYWIFVEAGTCLSPGQCRFERLELDCAGCAENCLAPCADVSCNELGPCRISGYCEPAGADRPPSCVYETHPDGTACPLDSGADGFCQGGVCAPCERDAQCDDANACTRDSCDSGSGSCQHEPLDEPCDDGDACTEEDRCVDGVCEGRVAVVCDQPPGPCHQSVGICSPEDGTCTYPPDSTACDDASPCTVDICLVDGSCDYVDAPDGTLCSDGDPCTETDRCSAGTCVGTDPTVCDGPPGQCYDPAGSCDPVSGACAYAISSDGTPCSDGDLCTGTDACAGGTCVGTDPTVCDAPPGPCFDPNGTCDSATGDCSYPQSPDGAPCSDDNLCTTTDACSSGTCVGADPRICDAPPGPCFEPVGACDPATGACIYTMRPNGTACNDQNACTRVDTCQAGQCVGGDPVVCNTPPGQCQQGTGTCNPANGMCTYPDLPNGSGCNDGNLCTHTDRCTNGQCGGTLITCVDTDCQQRSCNGTAQCAVTNRPAGFPCTSDGNACTDDVCNGAGSCQHAVRANGASCGSTAADRCCSGSCVDISSNATHCGGCGLSCAAGLQCESVAQTNQCSSTPAGVSGRCVCQGLNSQCPGGQICRTVTPHNNRCAPENVGDCAPGQTFVDLSSCPNYCRY